MKRRLSRPTGTFRCCARCARLTRTVIPVTHEIARAGYPVRMQFDRRIPTYLQMLALIGAIGISGYLTYTKATNGIPPCTVGGGCAAALYSPWGYIAGIPLAYIGLTASIVLLLTSPWRLMELRAISLVLFFVGAIFTIYLRYVEQAHFNGHVCAWCVTFMVFWWIAGAFELARVIRMGRAADADLEANAA